MNAYDVIIMPWLTEKTMEARTTQNRLEFIVRRAATKKQIARAVETIFEVEVDPSTFATPSMESMRAYDWQKATTQKTQQCVWELSEVRNYG